MVAHNEELAPAERLIDYYAMWMSNANFIMTLLLMLCATSNESRGRLATTLIMLVGHGISFRPCCLLFAP